VPNETERAESSEQPKAGADEHQPGLGQEGSPGSGRPDEDTGGAVAPDRLSKERDKSETQQQRPKSSGNEAQSPSGSRHQSDQQAEQGGDASGEGEQGGGQSAKQPGRDSRGSSTSSDQGNSGSPESGQGEAAERPGKKQPSPSPTGQSGRERGPGSQSRQASGGQQSPAGTASESPDDTSQKPPSSDAAQQNSQNRSPGQGASAPPEGGGIPSDAAAPSTSGKKEAAAGDDPNLQYARKATELVLERLQDQQQEPDPELLESLGWTPEELESFVSRWQTMKRNAREQGGEAREELEDALRSLGLRRSGPGRRSMERDNDQLRRLQDGGNRSRPPAEILEQFRAYRKGAARGQRDGGENAQ
jgi:hypothetical protein